MSEGAAKADPRSHGRDGSVDGILNIDKPMGITTMDVVRRIKRAIRHRHVGHGGTLDPLATGVAPICIGQATRMMEYLIDGTREYGAIVELGVETDTLDAQGTVTVRKDPSSVARQDVERALKSFEGTIEQVPPMYSALKRDGKRLYELARAGVEVERKPRTVKVISIEFLDWSPPLVTLNLVCGRGFYVRSLAHDLGQALGCGGHLKSLVRRRSGPFEVSKAMTLEVAEQRIADGTWKQWLLAPDVVVGHLRAAILDKRLEGIIRHGRSLPAGVRVPFSSPNEKCRVYTVDGSFLGIMSFNASIGQWHPDRVFTLSYSEAES